MSSNFTFRNIKREPETQVVVPPVPVSPSPSYQPPDNRKTVMKVDKSRDIRISFNGSNLEPLIDNLIEKANLEGKLSGIHYLAQSIIMLTLTKRTDMIQLHEFLKMHKEKVSVVSSRIIEPESVFVSFKGVHVLITEQQFYEILKTKFLDPVSVKWLRDKRGLPRNERIVEFNRIQFAEKQRQNQLKNYLRIGDDIIYLRVCTEYEDSTQLQVQHSQNQNLSQASASTCTPTQETSITSASDANIARFGSIGIVTHPNVRNIKQEKPRDSDRSSFPLRAQPCRTSDCRVGPWPSTSTVSHQLIDISSTNESETEEVSITQPIPTSTISNNNSRKKSSEASSHGVLKSRKRGFASSTDSDGSTCQRPRAIQPIILSSTDRSTVAPDTSKWPDKPNMRHYANASLFFCIAYHTRSFDPKKRNKFISRKAFDDLILRYVTKYPQPEHWDGSVETQHFARLCTLFNVPINVFQKEAGNVKPVFVSNIPTEDNILLIDYKDGGKYAVIVNFDMYTTSFMCKFCGISFPTSYSGMLHRKNKVCRRRDSNDADDESVV